MPQDIIPTLQEIREKALQHFSHCHLNRAPDGDNEDAPLMNVDIQAYRDPEASIEEAWVAAISAAMARHMEETIELERNQKANRKALNEIEDFDERKTMRIVLTQQHAAEKIALKERQDAALQEFIQGYPKHPDFDAWVQEQERKISEENQGEVEGSPHVPPKHLDIRDFKYEILEHGVRFRRSSGTGSFTDFGKKISITDWQDPHTTLAALQLASEKWESFTIYGPPEYMNACAKLAAIHGFKIDNPEVQEMVRAIRISQGLSDPEKKTLDQPRGPKM